MARKVVVGVILPLAIGAGEGMSLGKEEDECQVPSRFLLPCICNPFLLPQICLAFSICLLLLPNSHYSVASFSYQCIITVQAALPPAFCRNSSSTTSLASTSPFSPLSVDKIQTLCLLYPTFFFRNLSFSPIFQHHPYAAKSPVLS